MESKDFWIRLAGEPLHLAPAYPYMKQYCQDYLIQPNQEDMIRFRQVWGDAPLTTTPEQRQRENLRGISSRGGYLETLALYRMIAEGLIQEDILLFHGSTLAIDGRAYIFTAPSGTGKSTHRGLWQERFGDRAVIINDDKPMLRFTDAEIYAYGTPYGGKDGLNTNLSAPLAGIVVLHQAPENTIRPMTEHEIYPALLTQTYRPTDPQKMMHTMDLLARLAKLPVYSLGCTISQEAVELAYRALNR